MAIELACACGCVFHLESRPAGDVARCPRCSGEVRLPGEDDPQLPRKALKPLWAMMGGEAPAKPAAPPEVVPQPVAPTLPTVSTSEPDPPKRKGLWSVMAAQAAPTEQVAHVEQVAPAPAAIPYAEVTLPTSKPATREKVLVEEIPADEIIPPIFGIEMPEFPVAPRFVEKTGRSVKAVFAVAMGGTSVLLSFFALFNTVWSDIPATATGFAGIVAGFLAASEIQRSRGKQTGMPLAAVGVCTGVLGMFLGPVIFSRIGRHTEEEVSRQLTVQHLKSIGQGLNRYYEKEGAFPPGGIFEKLPEKGERGMHGWMTMLLPYLGEQDLFSRINLKVPYDDDENLPAMNHDVPVFFAAGADRSKLNGKFGVAHFAGVGGEVTDEGGGYTQAGIFGQNSAVTKETLARGLSNTLAAGEVGTKFPNGAEPFPAWGDPDNMRVIERGLNQDIKGFGNADGSGACFLMADGSVRYFSNRTDKKTLIRLSLRDAEDAPAEEKKPGGKK